jgi:hypothetical protein
MGEAGISIPRIEISGIKKNNYLIKMVTKVSESIAITKLITNFGTQNGYFCPMKVFNNPNKCLIVTGLILFICSFDLFSQEQEYDLSQVQPPDSSTLNYESAANPYLLPPVFEGLFADGVSIQSPIPSKKENLFDISLPVPLKKEENFVDKLRKDAYRYLIRQRIDLVKYKKSDLPEKVEEVKEMKPTFFDILFKVDYAGPDFGDKKEIEYKYKKKYWTKNGSSLIQFTQNYISDNWYKGGVGNLSLLNVQKINLNYKKGRIQSNNLIEWKLSFFTNPKDTLRNFRIGEDLIRTYSDFGVRAFNDKWSYSTNIEIKTQLFKNYQENSQKVISSVLSPVMINMGILGMKYQLNKTYKNNKYKKLTVSADISPLSVQYTYVNNKEVDPKRFGIEEGENSLLTLGSTINANFSVQLNRQVAFTSRLKYFSNYESSAAESENELNLSLSRYFSTRIYWYFRFDDNPNIKKDPGLGYWQMTELFSFGFKYDW